MTRILVLGAGGYLGETTIRESVAAGIEIVGLVRREDAAERVRVLGGTAEIGDASVPAPWKSSLEAVDVVVDLVQPALPKRITRNALERISVARVEVTRAVCAAIVDLPEARRPVYLSVGGCDELAPDGEGSIDDSAPLRDPPVGGGRIGIPVHRAIHASGVAATSVYFGVVYGAGKAFAKTILPRLRAGSLPIIGSGQNRLPLIHVEDAARVLVHLAGLGKAAIAGRSFVAAHSSAPTAGEFFDAIAVRLGARRPRHLPAWLVGLVVGAGAVELMTIDARVTPRALLSSGFAFRYPSLDAGIEAMLTAFATQDSKPRSGDTDAL